MNQIKYKNERKQMKRNKQKQKRINKIVQSSARWSESEWSWLIGCDCLAPTILRWKRKQSSWSSYRRKHHFTKMRWGGKLKGADNMRWNETVTCYGGALPCWTGRRRAQQTAWWQLRRWKQQRQTDSRIWIRIKSRIKSRFDSQKKKKVEPNKFLSAN